MKCAECLCVPQYCNTVSDSTYCVFCTKDAECCCISIHTGSRKDKKTYFRENANLTVKDDDCCLDGSCNDNAQSDKKNSVQKSPSIFQFFKNVKGLYAAALGIEILLYLCRRNWGKSGPLYFWIQHVGIPIAYALGYMLAGFVTFVTILGRYDYDEKIDSCCSILGENAHRGLFSIFKSPSRILLKGGKRLQNCINKRTSNRSSNQSSNQVFTY